MRRVFPWTAVGSALACVTEAARADHDSRIGIGEGYHLSRLPPNIEQQLASALNEFGFATEQLPQYRPFLLARATVATFGKSLNSARQF
jgi:hypothetical protein